MAFPPVGLKFAMGPHDGLCSGVVLGPTGCAVADAVACAVTCGVVCAVACAVACAVPHDGLCSGVVVGMSHRLQLLAMGPH